MQGVKPSVVLKFACAIFAIISTFTAGASAQYDVEYSFPGGPGGWGVSTTLISDAAGNFYGTTYNGGNGGCNNDGCGIVFKLSPVKGGGWTETVLYTFTGGNDGANPTGQLLLDKQGNLYGEAYLGGSTQNGLVFELSPTQHGWKHKVLHTFRGGTDGVQPIGGLTFDRAGNIYGATYGSNTAYGTVFRLTRSKGWKERVLHQFPAFNGDGFYPYTGVTIDKSGNLYGATFEAGDGGNCCGVVYKLAVTKGVWTETILYAFTGLGDGGGPDTNLIFDGSGNLYGTTYYGGNMSACQGGGCGVVFQLAGSGNSWKENVLYAFSGGSDGAIPRGSLGIKSGRLYGTTYQGGNPCPAGLQCGVLYEVKNSGGSWGETILHSFENNGSDGILPTAGMFLHKGAFYSTTYIGGNGSGCGAGYGCGTMFKLIP